MPRAHGENNSDLVIATTIGLGNGSIVPEETAREWLDAIRTSDHFMWRTRGGAPVSGGLPEVVSGRVADAIGKCDREGGCLLSITTEGVYGSDASQSSVLLECALKSLVKNRAGTSAESECTTHHNQARPKLAEHIVASLERLKDARQALEDAEIGIQEAEQAL